MDVEMLEPRTNQPNDFHIDPSESTDGPQCSSSDRIVKLASIETKLAELAEMSATLLSLDSIDNEKNGHESCSPSSWISLFGEIKSELISQIDAVPPVLPKHASLYEIEEKRKMNSLVLKHVINSIDDI